MPRRWSLTTIAVLLALLATACDDRAAAKPPAGDLPASMAGLGDSITAGVGACLTLDVCLRHSWSTGHGILVDSHYVRIRAGNRAINGHAHNLAKPGARSADLAAQATAAVSLKVEYLTVLVGGNDICRATFENMTSPATYRSNVDKALAVLRKGLPQARVLVASVPDLYRVWEIGHTVPSAVRRWNFGVCPALLARADSTAPADVRRRAAVRDRVTAYNRALADACRAYGPRCRYDGGAAHQVRFTVDMLNPLDYFHPDASGQDALAAATIPARFGW